MRFKVAEDCFSNLALFKVPRARRRSRLFSSQTSCLGKKYVSYTESSHRKEQQVMRILSIFSTNMNQQTF